MINETNASLSLLRSLYRGREEEEGRGEGEGGGGEGSLSGEKLDSPGGNGQSNGPGEGKSRQ